MGYLGILQSVLHLFSTALLYPVILSLLVLTGWVVVKLGEFISEYSLRNRDLRKIETGMTKARQLMNADQFAESAVILKDSCSNSLVARYTSELASIIENVSKEQYCVQVEKMLQDYELRVLKKLERTRIVAQIAPMLGLMGTLIPLGPGLIGLIEGNIAILAQSLIIAFSTTVIGLVIGAIAYAITTVRRRWYAQDISDIEYISALLIDKNKGRERPEVVS